METEQWVRRKKQENSIKQPINKNKVRNWQNHKMVAAIYNNLNKNKQQKIHTKNNGKKNGKKTSIKKNGKEKNNS